MYRNRIYCQVGLILTRNVFWCIVTASHRLTCKSQLHFWRNIKTITFTLRQNCPGTAANTTSCFRRRGSRHGQQLLWQAAERRFSGWHEDGARRAPQAYRSLGRGGGVWERRQAFLRRQAARRRRRREARSHHHQASRGQSGQQRRLGRCASDSASCSKWDIFSEETKGKKTAGGSWILRPDRKQVSSVFTLSSLQMQFSSKYFTFSTHATLSTLRILNRMRGEKKTVLHVQILSFSNRWQVYTDVSPKKPGRK